MIIDFHTHITFDWGTPKGLRRLLTIADRFKIQWLCTSMGPGHFIYQPTETEIRDSNDHVIRMTKWYPNRIIGFCYLNPRHGKRFCLAELSRCLSAGMRGIKLWVACKCSDPRTFPIVEQAIRQDLPLLQHTWKRVIDPLANESDPEDIVAIARRFPESRWVMAHAAGLWEYGIKAVQPESNILIDVSGGNPTQGLVELALAELSPERILFGSDAAGRSFASQLAKVDGVAMSKCCREKILSRNAQRLLHL